MISDSNEIKIQYDCQLPDSFKKYLITIEDKRFLQHNGVDYKSILRALYRNIKNLSIVEGGSTITQQLARNLLKENDKTITRKWKETKLALMLEKTNSKNDILHLYFNNVYWGKNIYGIRAASISYFGKEPHNLNRKEKLKLITLLRGPNLYLSNSSLFQRRYELISKITSEKLISVKQRIDKKGIRLNTKLTAVNPVVIDYMNPNIDSVNKIIYSSIDIDIQNLFIELVKSSKYPTSIICLYKGNLIGFSSFYGSDYPFTFKSNVGSLLKPFVYSFLRKEGVSHDEVFSTQNNSEWYVREVSQNISSELTIKQALFVSNNNVFINASEKIGMQKVIAYIAKLINKENETLYPSSILGATASGMSLYDITKLYHQFYSSINCDSKKESLEILNELFRDKLNFHFKEGFFKTGTTNNNKERFSIFGNKIMTVGVLRQNYYENDYTKEGNFISFVRGVLNRILSLKKSWFK